MSGVEAVGRGELSEPFGFLVDPRTLTCSCLHSCSHCTVALTAQLPPPQSVLAYCIPLPLPVAGTPQENRNPCLEIACAYYETPVPEPGDSLEMQPLPHLPVIHFVRPVSTAAQEYLENPRSPRVSPGSEPTCLPLSHDSTAMANSTELAVESHTYNVCDSMISMVWNLEGTYH